MPRIDSQAKQGIQTDFSGLNNVLMEARHGDERQAQTSADRDVANGQNESTSQVTFSQDDMDEINAVDIAAPLAAVPGVLELSEEVSDRIASDNDALTDAFAAQVMEQSATVDDTLICCNATGKVGLGLVAVGGCVASVVLIALIRRIRRGRSKASDESSQKVSGSAIGSRSVFKNHTEFLILGRVVVLERRVRPPNCLQI